MLRLMSCCVSKATTIDPSLANYTEWLELKAHCESGIALWELPHRVESQLCIESLQHPLHPFLLTQLLYRSIKGFEYSLTWPPLLASLYFSKSLYKTLTVFYIWTKSKLSRSQTFL
jgi:hypothetical protein